VTEAPDTFGGGQRDAPAELPGAEGRHQHQWGHAVQLHGPGHYHRR